MRVATFALFGLLALFATQAIAVTVAVDSSNAAAWARSDGGTGTSMPQGGPAIWSSQFVTSIPAGATNIAFTLNTFLADDKGVMQLNGTTIADAVVQRPNGTAAGAGTFDFGLGAGNQAYNFVGFAPGASFPLSNGTTTFTLKVFMNDTSTTDPSAPPLAQTFISSFSVSGTLTYDITLQPASLLKSFSPTAIAGGGTTVLTFALHNPANNPAQTVSFVDTLPAGLRLAALPNVQSDCGAVATTATPGSNTFTVTNATVPAGPAVGQTICTITVGVTNVPGQTGTCPNASFTNAAANISGGTNVSTAGLVASCVTVTQPTLTKSFSAASINEGGSTNLTFTISNFGGAAANVGFVDTLPAGLQVFSTPVGGTCAGGAAATSSTQGGKTITVSNLQVPANSACTLLILITNVPGQYGTCPDASFTNAAANISGATTITNAVQSSCLTVTATPPSLNKAFNPATIVSGGTTTLTFTLTNPAPNNPVKTVSFTDTLPAGLQIAASPNVGGTCTGGTVTAPAGSNLITVAGRQVPSTFGTSTPNTCTITVDITNVAGQSGTCPATNFTNAAANISATTNVNNQVTASCVTVTAPTPMPSLNKAFSPSIINAGATSTLTFTITNPATNNPAQTFSFNDTLPSGLQIAAVPNVGGTCTGGTVTAMAAGNTIGISGRTVPASGAGAAACTITVDVTNVPGQQNASCTNNPAAFTNGTGNISALSNLTNAVTQSCLVIQGFSLAISKAASATNLPPNSPLTYTITVTNNGPAAANGAILTDPAVGGFAAAAVGCSNATNGAACPPPGNVTLANLQGAGIALPTFPANATITFQLTGTLTQSSGTVINTATIATPAGAPLQTQSSSVTVAIVTAPVVGIPTLSEYALLALMLSLAMGGALYVRRARR